MDRLSSLRAEANEVAERIDSLTALESDNQADIDARNMELEGLTARAKELTGKIQFEEKVADSVRELKGVTDRCQPAPGGVPTPAAASYRA